MGLKTYLLIRIGMDVGREEWFGEKLADSLLREAAAREKTRQDRANGGFDRGREAVGQEIRRGKRSSARAGARDEALWELRAWMRNLRHPMRALRQRRRDRLEARQEQERRAAGEREQAALLAVMAERLGRTEAAMARLAMKLEELTEGLRDCYCVYEDSIRRALLGQAARGEADIPREEDGVDLPGAGTLPALWGRRFQVAEFRGYGQQFWAEQLLPQAVLPHFVILGNAPCLFEVIESCARRMKSLRWILPETDCDGELMGFVEDFCTEYGLAIMLQPMESPAAFRRFRLEGGQPVNVLDFTGEAYLAVTGAPRGSVWLDMCSVEEKRRRIEARGGGITYVSLKEKWKTAQKRCVCPIVP